MSYSNINHQSSFDFPSLASLGHNDPGTLYTASGFIDLADSDPCCIFIYVYIYLCIKRVKFLRVSDSFLEESDTSLSHLDNSLPEFETFSDHTKETRSGSTTTHANYSLPEYDSFLFEIEPDQGGLTSIAMNNNSTNDPLLEAVNSNDSLPEFELFHFDPSFPRPPPEPPDVEICLNFEPGSAVINNFDVLNNDEPFDPGKGENVVFLNVEE
ncbi:hypothetical protein Tco_0063895, partial [Tanacetum coccineum]